MLAGERAYLEPLTLKSNDGTDPLCRWPLSELGLCSTTCKAGAP